MSFAFGNHRARSAIVELLAHPSDIEDVDFVIPTSTDIASPADFDRFIELGGGEPGGLTGPTDVCDQQR